jgi:hypothetical protein
MIWAGEKSKRKTKIKTRNRFLPGIYFPKIIKIIFSLRKPSGLSIFTDTATSPSGCFLRYGPFKPPAKLLKVKRDSGII